MSLTGIAQREWEQRDTYPLSMYERLLAWSGGMTARDYTLFGGAIDGGPRDYDDYLSQPDHARLVAANRAPGLLQNKYTTTTRYGDLMAGHWTIPSAVRATGLDEVIVKPRGGACGYGVERVSVDELPEMPTDPDNGPLYCEPIQQTRYAREINPAGVNTIRVITVLDDSDDPEIVAAIHRFGTTDTAPTDNWSGGGLAAPIDLHTGRMADLVRHTPGHREPERLEKHPETGTIVSLQTVPQWAVVMDVANRAAGRDPRNRYVGWDIAVTPTGPVLIEGNVAPHLSLSQLDHGLKSKAVVRAALRDAPSFFSAVR